METRIRTLIDMGDQLFTERSNLDSLWQDIAENFYPERADFTFTRSLGADFADHLMTSYPLLARRDLGNAFSAMLRPSSKNWFKVSTTREDRLDEEGRRWLEAAAATQRRAMYDKDCHFVKATREADHDFAAFGQACLSIEVDRADNTLLYRNWHLRDLAWAEGGKSKVNQFHRRWKVSARDLVAKFPKTVSPKTRKLLEKTPFQKVEVRHVVLPASDYQIQPGGKPWRTPYVSVYAEIADGNILEETGINSPIYLLPRWQTVSGSQYAYSPAVVAALPEARLIQAMTLTLLEAGEKAANPPLLAAQEALRGDLNIMAGGVTYVDSDYDERTGLAIRPIASDYSGLPHAMEMQDKSRALIAECFFLSKITMPPQSGTEMTATEISQRMNEYIRNAIPLFEPMEMEYNGGLCDMTFDLLLREGAFGRPEDMPQSLSGQEIQFRFESPLSAAIESEKGQLLTEAKAMLVQVADIDPSAAAMLNAQEALRDALRGVGVPATWIRSKDEMASIQEQHAQQQQADQLLAGLGKSAAVAKDLGQAAASFKQGGVGQGGQQPGIG